MPRLIFSTIIAIALQSAFGQSNRFCSVSQEIQEIMKERTLSNRAACKNLLLSQTGGSIYVLVRFFLTAKSDSTGRFQNYLKLFNFFCRINDCIGDHSMIFYIKEIDETISNTDVYENPVFNKLLNDFVKFKHDTINVFICKKKDSNLLGNYDWQGDYIAMDESSIFEDSKILCHNLGHFFSLSHTCGSMIEFYCDFPNLPKYPTKGSPEYVSRTKTDRIRCKHCILRNF